MKSLQAYYFYLWCRDWLSELKLAWHVLWLLLVLLSLWCIQPERYVWLRKSQWSTT
ncbi:hypothetical protein OK016_16740 [Vibrio chagasii]|nr:hypothetical protein [Vibrio chagasii]